MRPLWRLARAEREGGRRRKKIWRRAGGEIKSEDQRNTQERQIPNHGTRDTRAHATAPRKATGRKTHARSLMPRIEPAKAATIHTQP